ncbi:MAG: LURP-one-related family protein [Acidobacteriota bacterium]
MNKKKFFRADLLLKTLPLIIIAGMIVILSGCARYSYRDVETIPPEETRLFSAKVYFIDQKFFTVGDKFTISDEQGNPVFFVKERVFTVGDRLSFMDMNGSLIFNIKEKVFSLGKQFRIYSKKELVARVLKKIKPFNDKYLIDLPGDDDYMVRGDFINHKYSFFRRGRKVAQISKKWDSFTDNYMVQIGAHENDMIILASAIIIDMASHKEDR